VDFIFFRTFANCKHNISQTPDFATGEIMLISPPKETTANVYLCKRKNIFIHKRPEIMATIQDIRALELKIHEAVEE
ncbi:MAG: hypothetical protein K5867_06765, partial [Bacteroidales bacterium]|nr:hypothetical protein [Bacteroidales bacterium]